MSDPIDRDYLDSLYEGSTDPWRLRTGFYEQRKRAMLIALLPRQTFRSGFEPGCSNGALTQHLAGRCDRLLAADYHPAAVAAAVDAVREQAHVTIARLTVPDDWPAERFDLIVLSEFGYFLTPQAWQDVCRRTARSLDRDGSAVACHWRADFAQRTMPTATLHRELAAELGRPVRCAVEDRDFSLVVW